MINLLEAENLSFAYPGGDWIFKEVNLTLARGEILGIMGLSGSGKSTLCHCLSGIIPHVYPGHISGRVLLEGNPISGMKLAQIAQKLGILFQNAETQLFSSTLEEDVVFGPENLCWSWPELDQAITQSLNSTGMTAYRMRQPKTLSGGQGQLAALSAVLALNPQALLFDEAMSQLDPSGVAAVQDCALSLSRQGRGVLLVEHDPAHLKIANRLFVLEAGGLKETAL